MCRASTAAARRADTTHVSVVDAEGNCVSMTHSLGMPSGVITDGLGFMYNGCMGVFDPRPGRAGSLAPGKARFSSVVPSIVFEGDRPHLVIGAPGATQIAMGVLQALLNALDFDMTMVEAVSAPRFSATSNAIDVSNRIPRGVQRELEARGYEVVRSPNTYGFAAVHAIRVHPDGLDGGADPATTASSWRSRLASLSETRARAMRRVPLRGGARRQPARRTFCTLSRLSRTPTKHLGPYHRSSTLAHMGSTG